MTGFATIYRRELAGLFLMPLAWFLLAAALFVSGAVFGGAYLIGTDGDVNLSLRLATEQITFWFLMIFLPPLLTMRMISEEARSGVLEFLLTAPVGDAAVVVGKALAATTFMAILWLHLPFYALVLQWLGGTPDWGMVAMSWLGASVLSALFCAVGIVASALTRTPLLSAFLALLANLLILLLVPLLASTVGERVGSAGRERLEWVYDKLDFGGHYVTSFSRGVLDTGDVVFFAVWIGVFWFLGVRLVEAKRWR